MTNHSDVIRKFSEGKKSTGCNVYSEVGWPDDILRLYSYGSHFVLAVRLANNEAGVSFLVNGDKYSVSTSKHQSYAINVLGRNGGAVEIPFSALAKAGIRDKYEDILILERKADSYREVEYKDPDSGELKTRSEHLLGATLFKSGRKYYLSGIDESAKSWGMGYFLVQLPRPVQTVDEAYESLKPRDLPEGAEFKRQGEFFFVPVPETLRELKARIGETKSKIKGFRKHVNLATLIAGNDSGNPHNCTEVFVVSKGEVYARRSINHPQHKRLNLGNVWHRVYVNEARASFGADGKVD